jgi:hypothetical protein
MIGRALDTNRLLATKKYNWSLQPVALDTVPLQNLNSVIRLRLIAVRYSFNIFLVHDKKITPYTYYV